MLCCRRDSYPDGHIGRTGWRNRDEHGDETGCLRDRRADPGDRLRDNTSADLGACYPNANSNFQHDERYEHLDADIDRRDRSAADRARGPCGYKYRHSGGAAEVPWLHCDPVCRLGFESSHAGSIMDSRFGGQRRYRCGEEFDCRRARSGAGSSATAGATEGDNSETHAAQDSCATRAAQDHATEACSGALLRELFGRQGRRCRTSSRWRPGLPGSPGSRQRWCCL
jgi:hypothetical protein